MNDQTNISPLLQALLKPVARFCLRHALKFQDLLDAAKLMMLEVTREELSACGTNESVSKLSVVSGLQRSDINKHLRRTSSKRSEKSLSARIIGLWCGHARFLDKNGSPKVLSFEGRNSEFADLVAQVSKELNPYAVLFDLERSGHAQRQDKGLHLLSRIYISETDLAEAERMLGNDLDDLIGAVEDNVLNRPEIPNLHLKVHFDNICLESMPEIRSWLLNEGSGFIERVQSYLAQHDKDLNPKLASKTGGGRVALGVFSCGKK